MELLNSKQYQNQNNLVTVLLRTYNYLPSRLSDFYYFDSVTDWSKGVAGITNVATNTGTRTFSALTDSSLGIQSIQNYNPLLAVTAKTTRPFRLTALNQGGARDINLDLANKPLTKGVFENLGAGNTIQIRYYTNVALTAYYQVSIAMPVANTIYHAKWNKFVAGNYGIVGTAQTVGGQLYNTAQAVVTVVGGATGTTILSESIAVSTFGAVGVVPISLQDANNPYQFLGQPIQIPFCCTKELTQELERTYQDIKCGTQKTGQVLDTQKLDITLVTQKRLELLLALSYTTDLFEETLKLTGTKAVLPVTNFTAQLSGSVSVANFAGIGLGDAFGCHGLQRDYVNNTSATLDANFYHLNESTGLVTFSSSMPATEVEAYPYNSQVVRTMDLYTKLNPIRAVLEIQQKDITSTQTDGGLYLIDLGAGIPANDDEGDTYTFTNSVVLDGYRKAVKFTY
ncbi:MAG: hypothetical protein ACRCZ2_10055 [Fusobacteriaceae bacterium]